MRFSCRLWTPVNGDRVCVSARHAELLNVSPASFAIVSRLSFFSARVIFII